LQANQTLASSAMGCIAGTATRPSALRPNMLADSHPTPVKTAKKDSYFVDIAAHARYVPPFVNNSIDFGRSTP